MLSVFRFRPFCCPRPEKRRNSVLRNHSEFDTHPGKACAHPKTKAERDYSTLEAPPALAAPSTWASFKPASSYRPAASFRLVSFNCLRHRLWHLRCPCRPMPPPSRRPLCPLSPPGQCFDVEALVCVVLNTNPCHRPNVPQRTINLTTPHTK